MPLSIMKKLIPFIIGAILTIQAITPPLEFSIHFTNSPIQFVWTFLFFGILALYFIFTKANIYLRILIPYLFINCFFSRAPHLSMTAFIWVMLGAYFYLLCLHNKDWQPVFKILCCVFVLEAFLFLLKSCHKEVLLNFGKEATSCFGSVGNNMQFKSLLIILLAFLLQNMKSLKKYIVWLYGAIGSFGIYCFLFRNVWKDFLYARGAVWRETFNLSMRHPIIGWGIGTYKAVFPALARGKLESDRGKFEFEGVWENAHNELGEAFMEIGSIGIIPLLLYVLYLFEIKFKVSKGRIKITRGCRGLSLLSSLMVMFTMCFYFPMHQPHTSLLLVAFAAYRERQIREKILWQTN